MTIPTLSPRYVTPWKVGASFAPMSTAVVLAVLKPEGAANSAMGSIIVAAAIFNDLVALILLSLLEALQNPRFQTLNPKP